MPRYLVTLKEVWERRVFIEAESEGEAQDNAETHNFPTHEQDSFTFEYYLDDETKVEISEN